MKVVIFLIVAAVEMLVVSILSMSLTSYFLLFISFVQMHIPSLDSSIGLKTTFIILLFLGNAYVARVLFYVG